MTKTLITETAPSITGAVDKDATATNKVKTASSTAGKFVTITMALIIVMIVGVLGWHINQIERKYTPPTTATELVSVCNMAGCNEVVLRLMMEQDAQVMRTDRVRSTLTTRLAVFVIAEVVALVLVALGGVLVFDRVQSHSQDEVVNDTFAFRTVWPGVTLCFFGMVVLLFALSKATSANYKVTVFDEPVFVTDPNWMRNYLNIKSGQGERPTQTEEVPQ